MVVGEVSHETDVVVIGGGPGGYVAAIRAAELGLATVLVERDPALGGVCLHRGCMPSKTLAATAELAHRARNANALGLRIPEVTVDMPALRARQQETIDRLARGVGTLLDKQGVTVVHGDGVPMSHDRVAVAASEGSVRYTARRGIIVAVGARQIPHPGLRPDGTRVLHPSDALRLDRLPASVAVVGADYIAVQLAVALRKLGSAVTLLDAGHRLLPEVDPILARLAARGLRRLGIAWLEGARPLDLTDTGLRVRVTREAQGSDAPAHDDKEIEAEVVVLGGTARRPNVDDLGLDLVGLRQHHDGFILVDERQATSVAGIYAVGDVTPGPAWAHRAYRQGKVAAEAIAGRHAAYDPAVLPVVVLAEPELASVGLGEEAARALGHDPLVSRFPWTASGAALALGAPADGQTLVVSDHATGVVLGVHIAGSGAAELIGEGALALEMGATLEDLAATVHPHPMLSEGLVEAADLGLDLPTHVLRDSTARQS